MPKVYKGETSAADYFMISGDDVQTTETSVIDAIHDATMSKHPSMAAAARFLKEVMPVMLRWYESEADRDTSPKDMCSAMSDVTHSLLVSTIMTMCRGPQLALPVLFLACDHFADNIKKAVDMMMEQGVMSKPELWGFYRHQGKEGIGAVLWQGPGAILINADVLFMVPETDVILCPSEEDAKQTATTWESFTEKERFAFNSKWETIKTARRPN